MSALKFADYLGTNVDDLLSQKPFGDWELEKRTEKELPRVEVYYTFKEHGLDLICDEDGRIRTIFIRRGNGESLSEVPFSLRRQEVLDRFGAPSKSAGRTRVPVLGEQGAWDTFTLQNYTCHIQ